MNENLFPEIADLIGVELGEKFLVKAPMQEEWSEVYFNENGLYETTEDGCDYVRLLLLYTLLKGECEVEYKKFKPAVGEWYYTYDDKWEVISKRWNEDAFDYINMKIGACFHTYNIAKRKLPILYHEITGAVWE